MSPTDNTVIIFFGTSDFAIPALEALAAGGRRPAAVITRPDEPAGRKHLLTPPPVKLAAGRLGIQVFQPEKLDTSFNSQVTILKPDLFVVASYGKIIPAEILALPAYGALNIHPSLLPRWRGPSPIQAAILAGDAATGVTIIALDNQMDHGPIVAQAALDKSLAGMDYPALREALARLGADLLIETLPVWIAGGITPAPQDESRATYCKILTREDGRIIWTKSAEEIERMVRGLRPWPDTWTRWRAARRAARLRIEDAAAVADEASARIPGLVWQNAAHPLLVQAGRGSLAVRRIREESKKSADAASFVRGHRDIIGAMLG